MTRRRWLLLGGALVAAWGAFAGLQLLRAYRALDDGRAAAYAAREQLGPEQLTDGEPIPELRRARERFATAHRAIRNPAIAPLRLLPVAGRQIRSVDALSGTAEVLSRAALDAAVGAEAALEGAEQGGPDRVEQVRALTAAVRTADRTVRSVDDLGPRDGLIGPLADARQELGEQVADARRTLADATAGAEAGLRFLEGPGRYLVVAANNAEMRAGSGMWLTGGVLTTEAGRLSLGEVAPLYQQADPPNGAAAIADADLADRWDELWHPSWDWRGLMVSPRLPASAALGAEMWEAAGKPPIDGVLVVDPVALAGVVRATGPVEVGGRRVTADEVVPLLLHEQYLEFGDTEAEKGDRRESLGAIARAAFAALDEGNWSAAALASELADAVAGRHLLAWSADDVEQQGWRAAGMDGDLDADSLLVSVLNRGGNKLDRFLPIDADLTTRGRDVTVRLRVRNTAAADLPRYVAGPPFGRTWPAGRYVGVVAVNVPGAATDVTIDGAPGIVAGPDGASRVVAAALEVDAGRTREVVVRFRLPGRARRLLVEPSARAPGIMWRHQSTRWEDDREQRIRW